MANIARSGRPTQFSVPWRARLQRCFRGSRSPHPLAARIAGWRLSRHVRTAGAAVALMRIDLELPGYHREEESMEQAHEGDGVAEDT
jgi:hypothetical protein